MDETEHDMVCERYAALLDPGVPRADTERTRYDLEHAKIAVDRSFFLRSPLDTPVVTIRGGGLTHAKE